VKYQNKWAFVVAGLICLYFLPAPVNSQNPVLAAQLQEAPQGKKPDAVGTQTSEENNKEPVKKEPVKKDEKVPANEEKPDNGESWDA